jgi:multiple sugar transport system permease protein
VIALNVWTTSGTFMLFYLAYLQTISNDVYEAAAIDGANAWQAFWKITFPLLKPGHFFVLTVAIIGAFQMFDQAYIGGGVDGSPNNSLTTIVLYLYRKAIADFDFGYAAAVGVVLFVLIMAITLVQRRFFGQTPSWA